MGRDYIAILGAGAIISLVLALVLILGVMIVPLLLGGSGPDGGVMTLVKELAPVTAMLLIILSGLLYIGVFLAAIYEIATAKNKGEWKAIWAILLIVFGVIGLAAYLAIARKELRR